MRQVMIPLVAFVFFFFQAPYNPHSGCLNGQAPVWSAGNNRWECTTPGGGGLPTGGIMLIDSGSCPGGYAEVPGLDANFIRGTVAANADVGTTGGADSGTPAGTNSTAAFTPAGTNSTAAFTPAGTNSTAAFTPAGTIAWPAGVPTFAGTLSTVVINHVHVQNVNSATAGGLNGYGVDTSTNTSTASGYSTANPTGGSANYTPAGTNAWPAGVPTFAGTGGTVPAQTFTGTGGTVPAQTFTGTGGTVPAQTFTGSSFDRKPAFTRLIFCKKT